MRIRELLAESYVDQIQTDTDTLIATLKAKGKEQISTQSLVDQLISMGHNVNIHSIMSVLERCPFIDSFTPTTIEITGNANEDPEAEKGSESAEHVVGMADKQAAADMNQKG